MFSAGVRVNFSDVIRRAGATRKRIEREMIRPLFGASSYMRKVISRSVKVKQKPSEPENPPHSRTKLFRRSVLFDVNAQKGVAVVGFPHSKVGPAAGEHEQGRDRHGRKIDRRPMAGPALTKNRARIAKFWERK